MTWTLNFNFASSQYDWTTNVSNVPPADFGVYDGTKWASVWASYFGVLDERLYLEIIFATGGGTLTEVYVYYTYDGAIGSSLSPAADIRFNNSLRTIKTDMTANSTFIQSVTGLSDAITVGSYVNTVAVGGAGPLVPGDLEIQISRIILVGEGTPPYTQTGLQVPADTSGGLYTAGNSGGGAARIAAISGDGTYIYVAALDASGFPVLLQMATTLTDDAVLVFDPQGGDFIGVECGRQDDDVIWIAGQFDGTNVIKKSEDAGASFAVKDDGTIGAVRAFTVGPSNDDRVIVFDEDNGDILETVDDGASWTSINASVTPEINSIARFSENPDECVFGNVAAGSDSIDYSIDKGENLTDYQTGVYPAADATKVLVHKGSV